MAAAVPEEPLEFTARPTYLTIPELEQLTLICPSVDAFTNGFMLQEAEVAEVLRAAKTLDDAQVLLDPGYPNALDLATRVIRLLQLGLEVQFKENDQAVSEYNALREEFQDLEERERRAQADLNVLRAVRDRQGGTREGAGDLGAQVEELARRLDEEQRSNDRLRQEREQDERRIDSLEDKLQRSEDDLRRREEALRDAQLLARRVQDDYNDLRNTFEALRVEHASLEARLHIGDAARQQEWKLERLVKENRALELQNVELRTTMAGIRAENLEVSEKIVLLDGEVRKLKGREADLEAANEALGGERASLLAAAEDLRGELADKIGLLDSFEARFQRQFRSWEEERTSLQAQIDALAAGTAGGGGRTRGRGGARARRGAAATAATGPGAEGAAAGALTDGGAYDDDEYDEEVAELREQLNEAMEKEVLLLEAYEQLELSVAAEIDKALAQQAEELLSAQRRVDFLTARLQEERDAASALRQHQAALEEQLRDAALRNQQYEGGVYGLPQAVEEIHALKNAVFSEQARVRGCIDQVNTMASRLEDLADENAALRRKAGVPETEKVDISDIRLQKDATIAQLRSLNALLERQVADLEEERRKLRAEMKFRAKYHGRHALELGLTPDQLLLVEQLVDDIKHGRSGEARLVDQMSHRIQFLEVRLGEVMAYADIPPSMRPALAEFDPMAAMTGAGLPSLATPTTTSTKPTFGGTNVRSGQLDAVKAALIKSLGMLRELRNALSERRDVSDAQNLQWAEALLSQLTDVEQAVDAIASTAAQARPPAQAPPPPAPHPPPPVPPAVPQQPQQPPPPPFVAQLAIPPPPSAHPRPAPDTAYIAEAMADELRDRLRQLARQVAELQSTVIQKDATIQQLMGAKTELERRFGQPMQERRHDTVPRGDYDSLQQEAASLKEQLVGCLEELGAREREASDLAAVAGRSQGRLQQYADQVKMLYRQYAVALATWKSEKAALDRKVRKALEEADGHKAAAAEFTRAVAALSRGAAADLQRELADTVRRMAVVQVKHAKMARELEASAAAERALQERVEELEQEVADVSATCRSRMRWLEGAADSARRRVEALYREIQASVPLAAYHLLCEKHARQQGELRRLVEEGATHVVAAEELLRLRDEVATWMAKHDAVYDNLTATKEKLRQAEAAVSQAHGGGGPPLDLKLAQELVGARVSAEGAQRRAQLADMERIRMQRTLEETQARLQEVDERLAQAAAEVELLRVSRAQLEARYQGTMTREEVTALVQRLGAAEALAAEKHNDYTNLLHRAKDAEMKLEAATRDRQRHLAQITNLRAALRDVAAHREQAAVVARLHEQLDHALTKECLARNALNRSELARFEADAELRRLQADSAAGAARLLAHQDQARWSDKQRLQAQAQLDMAVAGRTEAWKAKLWSRKLQQLKTVNDNLADCLDVVRRRISKLEGGREAAELTADCTQEVSALLGKGISEVVRDAARLHEALLQARLEKGRLQRQEVLLKEKTAYVERVNAELHELLEKYEAEFFQQQLSLESDKAAATAAARELQDSVVALQDRLAQLLATTDPGPDPRKSRAVVPTTRVDSDVAARLKAHLSAAAAGDRDMMLSQIDSLHAARQEAEHLRHELRRVQQETDAQAKELADVRRHHNDALARLQQQSEALIFALNQRGSGADEATADQIRAVAEAAIAELKQRLAERQAALEAAEAAAASEKAAWLKQHAADRAEIERLNQALFKHNDESINNIKDALSRIPPSGPDGDSGGGVREAAQLRAALARLQEELAALRQHVADQEAAREAMERAHNAEVRRLMEDAERLTAALDAARAAPSGPTRQQVDKLESTLRGKDDKLRQLRDAFKALETKLIDAHKRMTDEHSKHVEEVSAARRKVREVEAEKARLEKEVAALQSDLVKARREQATLVATGLVSDTGGEAVLQDQLFAATERASRLDAELHRTRGALQRMRNAERSVVDLTTGLAPEAARQVEELRRQVAVLQQQNAVLKRKAQGAGEDLPGSLGSTRDMRADDGLGPGGGGGAEGAPGGSARQGDFRVPAVWQQDSAPERDTARAASRSSGPGDAAGAADDPSARTAAAVAHWEESKRLTRRIDDLKKKLATRQEELTAARAESDRRGAQVAALQKEVDRQAAAIRDMQDKVKQGQAAGQSSASTTLSGPELSRLQQYAERLAAVEAELDATRAQLSLARGSAPGAAPPAGPARDGELFEARLQRDQAMAQAKRLKERLSELFGEAAAAVTTARAAIGRMGFPKRGGPSRAAGESQSMQQSELLGTIATLKAALEKATSSSTPTTKYMAEVQRRKEAQQEAASAKAETEKLRAQASTLQRLVGDLQAQAAELRRQLRGAQEAAAAAAAGGTSVGAATQAALGALQAQLSQRDTELSSLRAQLDKREAQLAEARAGGAGSGSGHGGAETAATAAELAALKAKLDAAAAENADLRAELNAFDPQFFDEIEDLKHEHYLLGSKVQEYEATILQLSSALGRPPPSGLPFQLPRH